MRNSAYEHQIPEQLFSTETEPAEGVSTAKALAIAMAQGQHIYTLTGENASQLNNITIDDGARAEIQQALVQGLEVTVHQAPITVNGWEGSGYAILDPEYGVGAYKISGGGSGAIVAGVVSGVLLALIGVGAISASAFWIFSLIIINILSSLITLWKTLDCDLGDGMYVNYAAIVLFAILPAIGVEAIRIYLMGFFASTGATSGSNLFCRFGQ